MENFYLSPVPTIVIVICFFIIFIALFIYYICSKCIISSYKFNVNKDIKSVIYLLQNTHKYNIWWPTLNKLWIYKVNISTFYSNSENVRVVIFLKSNKGKEKWEVFIKKLTNNTTLLTIFKETVLLSKLERVYKSTFLYKKDLIVFAKSLQKVLNTENY